MVIGLTVASFFLNGILKHVKKIEKICMKSEKSINSFEIEKRIGYLNSYRKFILFINLLKTFRNCYYAK